MQAIRTSENSVADKHRVEVDWEDAVTNLFNLVLYNVSVSASVDDYFSQYSFSIALKPLCIYFSV